ncbi:hypothetical protein J577_2741 [Acinetobacter sp. 263903-1]|uniref:Uncharacterized protein n=2 Tax=Acinetobacter radioresistens TaxID=40216 RepID=A0ABM9YPL7_ACIRA|nr:hypothetical protein ACIRA0001_1740 [Acinetobacter radioresistens SK82]EJO35582.1 hypothetical protein ACINWCA157_0949 [Acinetobacter radioresistens WC-A-157]EXB32678.1 hypothetical protein J546_2069 [Acinetobacter sp. 1461402]EXB72104.1 hypothetical protein J550_1804 [Acinetobacter sp. 230853]EXB86444.1 hypothetical protein J538_1417 [Acinetobacter sp. 272263]EXC31147.1 hypothetical protein J520_2313 [Acinetobacter sp. 869535]EXE14388.1 hypothetical protein J559_1460 [Acinetobacter sp. 98
MEALAKATNEDVIAGITRVLVSRGYSRKELSEISHHPIQ